MIVPFCVHERDKMVIVNNFIKLHFGLHNGWARFDI